MCQARVRAWAQEWMAELRLPSEGQVSKHPQAGEGPGRQGWASGHTQEAPPPIAGRGREGLLSEGKNP